MKKSKIFGFLGLAFAGMLSLVGLTSCGNGVVKGDPSKVKYFETIEECYIEYCNDQEANMTSDVAVLTFVEGIEENNSRDSFLIDVLYKDRVEYDNYVKISDYLKTSLNYLTSKGLNVYVINTTKEDLEVYSKNNSNGLVRYKFGFHPFSVCKNSYLGSLLNDYFDGESKCETLTDCLDFLIGDEK